MDLCLLLEVMLFDELGKGVVIFTVVLRSGAGLVADKELAHVSDL
jgi:hypothetical protein